MAKPANITEHWLEDSASAALRSAKCVAALLNQGIATRGVAGLALSGGRSPIAFFRELALQKLPWNKVSITLVDERWVPTDSANSNEHLVREHLLKDAAAAAHFVSLKTVAANPQDALAEREAALHKMPWPLDVIVLGMGEDGHTASLFPGADNLVTALDVTRLNLLTVIDPPHADHRRISLTMRALLHSKCLVLLIQGPHKRAVYERVLGGADVVQFPIAGVLNQHEVPVEVFWSP